MSARHGETGVGKVTKVAGCFFFFCRYKIDHDAISLTYARLDL